MEKSIWAIITFNNIGLVKIIGYTSDREQAVEIIKDAANKKNINAILETPEDAWTLKDGTVIYWAVREININKCLDGKIPTAVDISGKDCD
jgi:hypothetical protein